MKALYIKNDLVESSYDFSYSLDVTIWILWNFSDI